MVCSAGGRRRTRPLGALVAALVAAAALLSACSGAKEPVAEPTATTPSTPTSATATSSSATGDTTGAAPDWPACDDVWVDEASFPRQYAGCLAGEERVRADKMHCSSGQVIVTFADRYYAVQGQHVNETAGLSQDANYRNAVKACLA